MRDTKMMSKIAECGNTQQDTYRKVVPDKRKHVGTSCHDRRKDLLELNTNNGSRLLVPAGLGGPSSSIKGAGLEVLCQRDKVALKTFYSSAHVLTYPCCIIEFFNKWFLSSVQRLGNRISHDPYRTVSPLLQGGKNVAHMWRWEP